MQAQIEPNKLGVQIILLGFNLQRKLPGASINKSGR